MTFAIIFFLLSADIPVLAAWAGGYLPPNYLTTYQTTFITLSFPLIPLLALPMGATSIVQERESGTLEYLFSNPITKLEFMFGRTSGLLLATSAVVFIGFGFASIMVYGGNTAGYGGILEVSFFAAMMNAIMLGLALIISVLTKRKETAMGAAIFIWFLLAVVSDVGFFSVVIAVGTASWAGLLPIFFNPVETSRLISVIILHQSSQLGSTGNILNFYLHKNTLLALTGVIVTWLSVVWALVFVLFRHQDVV